MKGIDYTKALSRDREVFQDTIEKTNKAASRKVADAEAHAKSTTQKQRENFIEDRAELEKNQQKNLAALNEKVKTSIEDKSTDQAVQMQREREDFQRELVTKRKDFDQRLEDITASYKKSNDSEKDSHTDQSETNKKRYSRNIQDVNRKVTKKLEDYQNEMAQSGSELKDQYSRERNQLVRGHEDRLFDVQKQSAAQRAELKERISNDLRKTKEIHAAEGEQQKSYTQDRLNTMGQTYEDRFHRMARDYSDRNDSLVDTQQRDAVKANKEHQQQLTEIQRGHNKQFRMIELEKRRRDNGSGEFADVMNQQKGLKDEIIHQNRTRDLKGQLAHTKKIFSEKAFTDQDSFNESFRKEAVESTARLDRALSQVNADKIITVAHEKEKATKQVSNLEHQNKLERMALEQNGNTERVNSQARLVKLKENFVESMKQLDSKHKVALEDVTKVSNSDKNQFIKRMNEVRNKEIYEMQREFAKMMDSTVQDYESRLSTYQRDNEYLKLTMNQKLQNITDLTDKELETQRALFEDRRAADTQNHQVLMDEKDHSLKTNMTMITAGFQKKIDKMQVDNDTRLKLLTNDYENKLSTLKATTSKELAQKDTNHQIELARIKMSYEDDKNRIISGYEAQLTSLRAQNRDNLEQAKTYNKIS